MKKLLFIIIIFIFPLYGCLESPSTQSPNIKIHFIDVGQGDSILVQVNNRNLLIDSGPKENRSEVINFLDSLNITDIHYIIATHPHEDHIGNMSTIIKRYNIGEFYAPKVTNTSKSFENTVEALIYKNKKIHVFNVNTTSINLGEGVVFTPLSPLIKSYDENLNQYSTIFKISYGDTSFLFTGDAEKVNELDLLSITNLNSDVLKIAHHGSTTSSSLDFLKSVSPSVAIISVGTDNKYNHPATTTIENLKNINSTIYRTDLDGNITLVSDGKTIYKMNSYK